jgi:hypothetical protein
MVEALTKRRTTGLAAVVAGGLALGLMGCGKNSDSAGLPKECQDAPASLKAYKVGNIDVLAAICNLSLGRDKYIQGAHVARYAANPQYPHTNVWGYVQYCKSIGSAVNEITVTRTDFTYTDKNATRTGYDYVTTDKAFEKSSACADGKVTANDLPKTNRPAPPSTPSNPTLPGNNP